MCGRFTLFSSPRELQRFFGTPPPSFEILSNYNVAPTQEIPVIIQHEDGRHLKKRHWGLVPFWAKDTSIGSRMINARVETITSKPAFRTAIKHRRCLIPANGFMNGRANQGVNNPTISICLPVNRLPSQVYGKSGRIRMRLLTQRCSSPALSSPRMSAIRSRMSTTECP
jgi:hypothetical protein